MGLITLWGRALFGQLLNPALVTWRKCPIAVESKWYLNVRTTCVCVCVCVCRQFLPTPFAWYFHHLPDWAQSLSAVAVLTTQVAGSLLMLSPVKGQRLVAFYSQVRGRGSFGRVTVPAAASFPPPTALCHVIVRGSSSACLIPSALHKTPFWWCHVSNSPPTCSPLSPSITHSLFHSRLKTHLFHKSFPP